MTLDLLCLVADKNMEAAVNGLLSKPKRLGIGNIEHRSLIHPEHDPGCFLRGPELLRNLRSEAARALVLLDRTWDGAPSGSGTELEEDLERRLSLAGLEGWARAVVIEPELEAWVFSGSSHVAEELGWSGRRPGLRKALESQLLWPTSQLKPPDPKVAMEWALRQAQKPRSSSIYGALAGAVGTKKCTDRAFVRFRGLLQDWFPA